jgi:pimeloyl-ACP methyl ester carboxylesterase
VRDTVTEPARLGQVKLPDGRRLGWAEWGPKDGTPVLLCSGGATSRWLGFGADVVDRLQVRLVTVDRPGLGASDPAPGRTLLDWPRDVRRLAALRGLSGLAVIGFSQGAPFALACAAAGDVTGVAVVSGTDELANPGLRNLLAPEVRQLVDHVATDPSGADTFFRGFGSPKAMWELILAKSGDYDRLVYTAPAFAQAFQRALAEAFTQGPNGYARDTVLSMSPWPFDPAAITIPADLWYGELDASTGHSPDLGASLARRIPTVRRRVLPGVGGALLWTHAEDVLGSLLERSRSSSAETAGPPGN